MANVTIIGAGLMGSAVAWPLADNGHRVRLVGTHLDGDTIRSCVERRWHPRLRRPLPDDVEPFYVEQLPDALAGADVIVSGVSSPGVHWMGQTLAPLLWPGATVIAVTKGLEATPAGDLRILPDVLAAEIPASLRGQVTFSAISGPCIAGELAARRHSCVVFTGRDAAALRRLRSIFATAYYHIWLSTDIIGVEACAALKNAYTLGVGLAGGMLEAAGGPDAADAYMHNPAAALFGESAAEMARLVSALGGDPRHVTGLPGVGDQYVTCAGGRTVRLGRLLGQGLSYADARAAMAGETLESAEVVVQLARALPGLEARGVIGPDELPLLRLLCRIIVEGQPAEIPFDAFFGGNNGPVFR
jgi:glycerol-3-phosphate dehydrogenase (NAD(P)+)